MKLLLQFQFVLVLAKINDYYAYDPFLNIYEIGTLTSTLSYIEAPLGIEFSANDMIYFHAGIYSAFLIADKHEMPGWTGIELEINSVDMGLDFGATFLVNDALSINAGYQYGFTTLDDTGIDDAYISNIVIAMGYSFGG